MLQVVFGEGIASYMNDGGMDLAPPPCCRWLGRGPGARSRAADRRDGVLRSLLERPLVELDRLQLHRGRQHELPGTGVVPQGRVRLGNLLYCPGDNLMVVPNCCGASARTTTARRTMMSGSSFRSGTASRPNSDPGAGMRSTGRNRWLPASCIAAAALWFVAPDALAKPASGTAVCRPRSKPRSTPPTRSTRTSRKARTPTTSRRSRRSTPNIYGIALVTTDGKRLSRQGDVDVGSFDPVDLQGVHDGEGHRGSGRRAIEQHRRRRDRPGVQLDRAVEQHKGTEMNPLVNPGAIATTCMVTGRQL